MVRNANAPSRDTRYVQEEFVLTAIELMLMIVSRLEGGGGRRRCLFWCGWLFTAIGQPCKTWPERKRERR